MTIAVVGSRDYPDLDMVDRFINRLPLTIILMSGGAKGVDKRVEQAAARRGMKVIVYIPNWDKHGKGAGMIRNTRVVEESDAVVVFWDGRSKGSQDVIAKAIKADKLGWIFVAGEPPTFGGQDGSI